MKDRVTMFLAFGLLTSFLSPIAQAAKGMGPQWRSALLGVPLALFAVSIVFFAMAGVCWLTRDRSGR